MAVIKHDINVGNLHAIHDGLDCTTFTDMAISNSERTTANAFFGTSPQAFATNLRYVGIQPVLASELCSSSILSN